MSDIFEIRAANLNGVPMTNTEAQGALTFLGNRLPGGSTITAWGLQDGAFEATAEVAEGTTEAGFRTFSAGLMPAAMGGTISLNDDRGNPLYDCVVTATDAEGSTHPVPPPKPTAWTTART